jgi:site-specific recombinase XerC
VALRRFAKHLGMTRNLDCSKLLSIQFPSVELVAPATIDHSDYDRLLFGSTQLEQSWQDACDIAIIALQGHTGLTTGEVVALNCEDIPIGAGIVVVCRTHLEPRFAEIPPMVEAAIRHYLKSSPFGPCDGEALFVNYRGTRLTARGLQIRFRSRRDAFGLPPEIVPRTLRHRFIQKLAAERTPANDIAGLAGVEVSTVHHHLRLSAMSKKERVRRSARKPIADAA